MTSRTRIAAEGVDSGAARHERVEARLRSRRVREHDPTPADYAQHVSDAVRGRSRHVRRCYEQTLRTEPDAEGRLLVQFTIGESGRVSSARATSEIGDRFESCVARRVRGWSFDAPPGGELRFSKTFILESAEDA